MTVLENVLVAHSACNTEGVFQSIFAFGAAHRRRAAVVEACVSKLEAVGLAHKLDVPAGSLPYGEQRLLEIARALATGCELLLLDEPAAGMNMAEKEELVRKIRQITGAFQVDVVLIEHDIALIMDISDRIIVLNYGEKIAEGNAEYIQNHPEVINAYLGGEVDPVDD
jgi:branched-chain amino acid transport system ATP-binding protein